MAAAAPHFSGDLFFAFPANPGTLRSGRQPLSLMSVLFRGIPGPFYEAVVQAAEEAVVNALAANQDMTVRSVTQTQAYDVRYGPGHRPRVITKAVGGRGGGGTMGRPGP